MSNKKVAELESQVSSLESKLRLEKRFCNEYLKSSGLFQGFAFSVLMHLHPIEEHFNCFETKGKEPGFFRARCICCGWKEWKLDDILALIKSSKSKPISQPHPKSSLALGQGKTSQQVRQEGLDRKKTAAAKGKKAGVKAVKIPPFPPRNSK